MFLIDKMCRAETLHFSWVSDICDDRICHSTFLGYFEMSKEDVLFKLSTYCYYKLHVSIKIPKPYGNTTIHSL